MHKINYILLKHFKLYNYSNHLQHLVNEILKYYDFFVRFNKKKKKKTATERISKGLSNMQLKIRIWTCALLYLKHIGTAFTEQSVMTTIKFILDKCNVP